MYHEVGGACTYEASGMENKIALVMVKSRSSFGRRKPVSGRECPDQGDVAPLRQSGGLRVLDTLHAFVHTPTGVSSTSTTPKL